MHWVAFSTFSAVAMSFLLVRAVVSGLSAIPARARLAYLRETRVDLARNFPLTRPVSVRRLLAVGVSKSVAKSVETL